MQPFYQSPLSGDKPYNVFYGRVSSFRAHWHGEIEMIYAVCGKVGITLEGAYKEFGAGNAALISSAEIHSIEACARESEVLVLEIGYPLLESGFAWFAGKTFADTIVDITRMPALWEILHSILSQCGNDTPSLSEQDRIASEYRIRSLLFAFAAEVVRSVPMKEVDMRERRLRSDMLSMQQVLNYVNQHFAEPIDLEQAAGMAGYEKTRFCQLFKRAVGMPFHQYLNNRRIEAAKDLLANRALTIQAAAADCGFPEAKTFARVFRQLEGLSPQEYRNSLLPDAKTKKYEENHHVQNR